MEIKAQGSDALWIWVDNERKIVSFHEELGCKLLEFRSRELFWNCVDQYTRRHYRYQ